MEELREQRCPSCGALVGSVRPAAVSPSSDESASLARDALGYAYRALCSNASTVVGVTLFVLGWLAKSQLLVSYVNEYDEGIILSGANALLIGGAPYRDFYTNYAPGIFLILAGLWRLFGVSLTVYRLLAVAIHLALEFVAGRLTGRMAGSPRRFSWLACGIVSCWTILLQVVPFAWLAGLALGALTVERILWAGDKPTPGRFVAAGTVFGLVGCFRHDLFVYFTLLSGVFLLLPARLWSKINADKPSWRSVRAFLFGASIPLVLVWVPIVAIAGPRLVVRDIFLDQIRYVMPGRILPMPALFTMGRGARLPIFLRDLFPQAVAITLGAPLLALLYGLSKNANRTPIVFLAALSIAVIPQMMGRTDLGHALFTVMPGLIFMTAIAERIGSRVQSSRVRAALPLLVALALTNLIRDQFWPPRDFNRRAMRPQRGLAVQGRRGFQYNPFWNGDDQRKLVEYIQSHTDRGERIFIGCPSHQNFFVNEISPYFFADRLPGVRWSQFDPNVVTTRPVQEEMIESMERFHVRLVVLSSRFAHLKAEHYPKIPTSPLFDDYLRDHFVQSERIGIYTILTRDM